MSTGKASVAAAERALERLFRLTSSRKLQSKQTAAIGTDVTRGGYAVLRCVDEAGELSLGEVARQCSMDPAAAGRQVKLLEDDGLLDRRSGGDDARVALVRVTSEGRRVYRRVVAFRNAYMADILATWSERDRADLVRLVDRLVDNLESVPVRAAYERRIESEGARMSRTESERRIDYAGSVHDEREVDAVVEVLRGGPTALRIGRNVRAMEERVAALFGKPRGVMCNSGSSALYLAVEVLDLEPGDEIVTSPLTFSTDLAPMVRAGIVPAFVDVTSDTFQIDVDGIEAMIGPRTRAILAPNLIGNAPDWDAIRTIADRHGLRVVEDSCDALGATLRGTPTGARADISLTSFALSHIITAAGTGGMVCFDDDDLADRALLLRRWGRRSEVQLFGSKRGKDRRFFSTIDGDIEYDNLFIFDEVGWNFEPSELSAAFGVVQLDKLPENLARRQRSFELTSEAFARWPHLFTLPRLTEGVDTGWHMFPTIIEARSGMRRAEFQQWMERHGIDTRMVWTGNAARQPAFRHTQFRQPPGGLPNADRVMEWGVVLPNNHAMTDDDSNYIGECVEAFVTEHGLANQRGA